jgi:DNA helicase II / ATP-dependent DNA helicase PcrA
VGVLAGLNAMADVPSEQPGSELLADLNPPQREAVLYGDGALLVLAGAGSGKTRVITRRIAHLVQVRDVFPWRILAVTFTNKAAREMRDRLTALLGPAARDLVVSTFHSASAMILRREAERVGLTKSFVIYDDSDQIQVVRRAIRESGLDPASVNPREILGRIDRAKNHARLPDDIQVAPGDYRGQNFKTVYRAYQRALQAANAVDFGDLLLQLVHLLRKNPDIQEKYQQRFTHVLVDEFQDTNPAQYELLQLLAPPGSNLVVVGDDDQSIYRWRGAEVSNILGFPQEYPDTKVVKLEQNYRSDQAILEAANAVITHNPRRMEKRLWSARQRGEDLKLLMSRDERGEAQEVARRVHELVREGFIGYSGIAVFYRTNAQSRVLEEALRLGRVPYTLVSGRSFYERAEIKDASSYLRLMVNPRSDADLLRVINTPARGIGDTTVERLMEAAQAEGKSLFDTLAGVEEIPTLKPAAARRLAGFRDLIQRLAQQSADLPDAAQAVELMLAETGMLAAFTAEGTDEATARAENLRELVGAAQEFDLSRASAPPASPEALAPEVGPLQQFLEQISLVGEADEEVGEGRVALMTLHAAKGLEFDAVFMTGMEDGVFPHSRALTEDADEEELAEERRLCYVGFTRARKRLFVSLSQSRSLFGELKFNPPSRFLREVPPQLFGFQEEPVLDAPRPVSRVPPYRRTSPRGDDEGPRIDRSYSQDAEHFDSGDSVIGTRVRHSQFGEGKVVACDGQGPNAKLTVQFPAVGLKRVVARFLQPA